MSITRDKRDAIIDELYTRCSNGEISRDQREILIRKTNDLFMESVDLDSPAKISTEVKEPAKELTPKQKYDVFREAAYTRCANGEFSVETREALLEKAREQFFPITD